MVPVLAEAWGGVGDEAGRPILGWGMYLFEFGLYFLGMENQFSSDFHTCVF